ncbi:MAG: ABC transporter ATP-binding protein [Clostridiales Family XIII bacterium]|jgi:peptide/nickel transport system ATP-binding protein|nr:ABC transporter ATP-binding protein [Clostridiales Family XIII bacterium]
MNGGDRALNETILSVKNLTVEYKSRETGVCHAVNNVSFEVRKGETIGLVGETGAGKTTIALSIMRLLPMPPGRVVSGEILLSGENILAMPNAKMRNIRGDKVSMIFQDPMTALNPIDKVGDQISEMVRLHLKLNRADAAAKAAEMLETVGIPSTRFNDYPHQFSGGMKQRVIIAIALACKPELLLADEPTTALDVTIQAQVLNMMKELKNEFGTSMVLITHDLGVVAETCDRVAVVYAGEIVEIGTADAVFEKRSHPYTRGLFDSLPDITGARKRLIPIVGLMPDPTALPKGCKFSPRCPLADDACRQAPVELASVSDTHLVRCIKAAE